MLFAYFSFSWYIGSCTALYLELHARLVYCTVPWVARATCGLRAVQTCWNKICLYKKKISVSPASAKPTELPRMTILWCMHIKKFWIHWIICYKGWNLLIFRLQQGIVLKDLILFHWKYLVHSSIIIIIISLTSIFFQDKSRVWTAASQQH